MRVWRISNHANLSGVGGLKYPGRWHSTGRLILYTAEHPALAMLEILVHINSGELPDASRMLEISVPKSVRVSTVKLKPDWQTDLDYSRKVGDDWLGSLNSAILRVPSALMPTATNYLMNPLHPDARRISIIKSTEFPFDQRLK